MSATVRCQTPGCSRTGRASFRPCQRSPAYGPEGLLRSHDEWSDPNRVEDWAGLPRLTRVFYTSVHRDPDRPARVELGHPLALPCESLVELEVRVATAEEMGHYTEDRFLSVSAVATAIATAIATAVATAAGATLPAAVLPWALVGLEQHSRLACLWVRADRLTLDPTHLLCELGALRKLTLNARHLIASGRASPSPSARRVSRIRQLEFSGTADASTVRLSPTEFPELERLTIDAAECDLSAIAVPRSTVYWLRLRGPRFPFSKARDRGRVR